MAKGMPDLYNDVCRDLDGQLFIDWITGSQAVFGPGMICSAIVWYVKTDRWYLEEAQYLPKQEEDSTWYARSYNKHPHPGSNTSMVMKYFKLENDETLITTHGKKRPVILLSHSLDSWWNPVNTSVQKKNWLCVPLFTYKDRHPQSYVLEDQKLANGQAFYIPSFYNDFPGTNNESSARFQSIQMINEEHLTPLKHFSKNDSMNRPFGLTRLGLELLMYHFYNQFNLFPELTDVMTYYSLFRDEVQKRISIAEKAG